jgi:transcriptional regulator with XRE-family HTH domain
MQPLTRTRFGDKLRTELDRQHLSVRKLARQMSPENPEPMRRNLARWIGGYNRPSRIHRVMVAEALGVPLETFDEDDEEGDIVAALVRAIRRVVREELKSREETNA